MLKIKESKNVNEFFSSYFTNIFNTTKDIKNLASYRNQLEFIDFIKNFKNQVKLHESKENNINNALESYKELINFNINLSKINDFFLEQDISSFKYKFFLNIFYNNRIIELSLKNFMQNLNKDDKEVMKKIEINNKLWNKFCSILRVYYKIENLSEFKYSINSSNKFKNHIKNTFFVKNIIDYIYTSLLLLDELNELKSLKDLDINMYAVLEKYIQTLKIRSKSEINQIICKTEKDMQKISHNFVDIETHCLEDYKIYRNIAVENIKTLNSLDDLNLKINYNLKFLYKFINKDLLFLSFIKDLDKFFLFLKRQYSQNIDVFSVFHREIEKITIINENLINIFTQHYEYCIKSNLNILNLNYLSHSNKDKYIFMANEFENNISLMSLIHDTKQNLNKYCLHMVLHDNPVQENILKTSKMSSTSTSSTSDD
jgi:hypothetical protein